MNFVKLLRTLSVEPEFVFKMFYIIGFRKKIFEWLARKWIFI